jgi:hypothetical protein
MATLGKVWEWGREVGGHSWRTAGDLGLNGPRCASCSPVARASISPPAPSRATTRCREAATLLRLSLSQLPPT